MAYTSRQDDQEKKYEVQPYQSQWQSQLDDTMGKILNREKFSYDLNGDALYQQYKDRYVNQGRMAMMDTMGQAQAMTGGYGNSYAQSVGQQTYQNYLQGLNDKIPELYNLALSKYQMEGDQLKDQYSILGNREAQDYGRWAADRDFGYGQFVDDRNYQYQLDERDYGRWQDQQALALQQAQAMIDKGVRPSDEMLEQAGLSKEYLDAMLKKKSSGWDPLQDAIAAYWAEKGKTGGNTGTGGDTGTENGSEFTGTTYSEAVAYMKEHGVDGSDASGIMTSSEWNRRKNAGSTSPYVTNHSTYQDYLASIVEYKIGTK